MELNIETPDMADFWPHNPAWKCWMFETKFLPDEDVR